MSERAYEDGTPAAYEPKHQNWMRRAAIDWVTNYWLCRFQPSVLADVIAKHAPKPEPQPIRRGDVVQLVANCRPKSIGLTYIVEHIEIVEGIPYYAGSFGDERDRSEMSAIAEALARIGRARYYPDGTPVED